MAFLLTSNGPQITADRRGKGSATTVAVFGRPRSLVNFASVDEAAQLEQVHQDERRVDMRGRQVKFAGLFDPLS